MRLNEFASMGGTSSGGIATVVASQNTKPIKRETVAGTTFQREPSDFDDIGRDEAGPQSAVGKSVSTNIGGVEYHGVIDRVFRMGPYKDGEWYGKASFMNDRHSGKGFNVKLDPDTWEPISK